MFSFVIRPHLPSRWRSPLWGDRERWGLSIREDDPCWQEWQRTTVNFYEANQRQGLGTVVNDAGYRVMSQVDLSGCRVLEIGPGDIRHHRHWRGRPAEYIVADVEAVMLGKAVQRLESLGVNYRPISRQRSDPIALPDGSVDVVVTFYSLEHLHPLAEHLDEIVRVLRPGGTLIGAIPAAGGLAWGGGRMLTSRRWLKRHTTIDPDKLICWEHPNFADDVLAQLDRRLQRQRVRAWPFGWLPLLDLNLIISLLYRKSP